MRDLYIRYRTNNRGKQEVKDTDVYSERLRSIGCRIFSDDMLYRRYVITRGRVFSAAYTLASV